MRHTSVRRRLTWALVFLTWFAQLCLPVAHASVMASHGGAMAAWCGDPANAREAAALLPPEIRNALDPDAQSAEHLASCAKLCAAMAKLPPLLVPAPAWLPPAVETAPPPARFQVAVARHHSLPPPPRGPPAGA